ncbi:5-formyltetrahydrofolate cyclo-ligase [archaeon 13_1_40CM_4_53_4]|nr:MAG: 5-formyltetrahydrofolate cyclo-ligase [archaeon 13_2_20CM_2_53_6]OLC60825.1 MAG: 5-formyltetrahydrofolate cyclo-ligase [archaeon 13_1_40CM_4_53_4]OLE58908.1 MAG: 5-formyltetrahydrofolate cyclo-ligase [Crenarchaeota archaeon 13_1_20CM_2_53_14]TMI26336.1 MAG: 5-formyltetrahydrofolate cyclo-ligase [Candidatus Bathyarchaeota archaeon]
MGEAQTAVEKENLRRYILRLRDRQSIGEVEQKSQDTTDQVLHLHEYVRARGIACYVNKDTEVDTRVLIRTALDQGKRVLVPVVKKGDVELFFSEIKDLGKELAPGTFGILEPKQEFVRPVSLDEVDVIFVPGIVWDREGYRLGWGRGYFDRAIKKLPPHVRSAGLAFNLQLITRVPRDQFDVPVDMVVTESRVIRCHK